MQTLPQNLWVPFKLTILTLKEYTMESVDTTKLPPPPPFIKVIVEKDQDILGSQFRTAQYN